MKDDRDCQSLPLAALSLTTLILNLSSTTILKNLKLHFLKLSIGCRAGFVVFIVMETFTYQMEETVWIVTDAIIVSTASMVMGTWNVSPARYSS